jgi:gluconate 2-dehydrogenase subunit 3-like protein
MDRRTTIKWVLAASAAWRLNDAWAVPAEAPGIGRAPGYGTDPNLVKIYRPGEFWPLTFTLAQRRTATALADVIIPADSHSGSASAVGVVEFLDEWVSAPYPRQIRDRPILLEGLEWMDAESGRRFRRDFASLGEAEQHSICDDIGDAQTAAAAFGTAARFFALFRDLTVGGFYTTPEGRKDLQYIGNVALGRFQGPPADLLARLGLGQ